MTTLVPRLWTELSDWLEQDGVARGGLIRMEDRLTDTEYIIRAELPGMDPEKDIQIAVARGLITVHAERKDEHQTQHRSEFRYGRLQRSARLPANSDEDGVTAHYSKGILEITVPLKPRPGAKQITITKD